MKFSIKGFFSHCDHWSYLPKISWMESFTFYAVEIIFFFATFLKIILHAFSTWEKKYVWQTLAFTKFFFAGCQKTENTAQKMKFSIKDFFSKYDQIHRKLQIWSHLLKKFLMEKLHFLSSVKAVLPKFLT